MMSGQLFEVTEYNQNFNRFLPNPIVLKKIYQSDGLRQHLIKRKHFRCLKYLSKVADIIANPDYIGVNPNETGVSFELVKIYSSNIVIGIKLDPNDDYLYISTMYEITEAKIKAKCKSGRLQPYTMPMVYQVVQGSSD